MDAPAQIAQSFIQINKSYLKSIAGILKAVEFVLLLLAWAVCASFKNGFYITKNFSYKTGAVGFFLFATVTLWILIIIIFILNLLSLMDKLKIPVKLLILAGVHAIGALLLLISSAVVAADAVNLHKQSTAGFVYCKNVDKEPKTTTTCETYDAAVAFGFFSFLAFVVDAVVHFFNHRSQA